MAVPKSQTAPDGLKLEQFGGMLPGWDDHLIPQGQAASSLNGYLFNGNLAGWRKPTLLYTLLSGTTKFAYRLPRITENIASAVIYVLAKPVDGDTVTLGEEIYTFRDIVEEAYDVFIGASDVTAVTNLFQAFTADDGQNTNAGTNYGIGTIRNPAINQHEPTSTNVLATDFPRIQVFAPDFGAAFNSTSVEAADAARLEWRYGATTTTTFQGGTNLTFDASITGDSVWMEFDDPDTDVLRSPVVDDNFDRYYFASASVPPKYNTRDRILAGDPAWLLGVPAPGCAPGVEVTGGGDQVDLGFTETAGTNYEPGANTIYLIPVTPDAALRLDSVTITPRTTNAAANFAAVIYTDDGGSPGTRINTSEIVTGAVADTDIELAFQNPTGLNAAVQFWIGFMSDSSIEFDRANNTGTTGVRSTNTFSGGPPLVLNNLTSGQPELHLIGNATSSSLLSARSYVYTYLTEYGEESPPSPATLVTGWSNGVWTLSLFTPPPDQMGVTRNITTTRIYRTITAQAGPTTYFFVAEQAVELETYVDTIGDDVIAANFLLQSQLWTPPPENLQGFVSLPNGVFAGWKDNEIWFSEPYRPHAWPPSYVLTSEYPIVGLGVTGNSVVACTSGAPYIASGSSPGTMSGTKVAHSEPCHSRGSIVSNNDGVYYTSPNGLILVTQAGTVQNTSDPWITREKWKQLTPNRNLRSVFLASSYYSLGCVRNGDASVAQQGFTIELNAADAQSFTIWPQPGGHRIGFSKLGPPNGFNVDNVFLDPWSGVGCILQNGGVYYFDFEDQASVMQTYVWKSKLFQQKSKKNFEAMRIWFSIPDGTPALNATRLEAETDDAVWDSLPADRYGFIRVYAGPGVLVTVREIRVPQEILRILSGFKYETWQFEIEARVPISNIQIGTSVKALANL
jgi:hypothetical protein